MALNYISGQTENFCLLLISYFYLNPSKLLFGSERIGREGVSARRKQFSSVREWSKFTHLDLHVAPPQRCTWGRSPITSARVQQESGRGCARSDPGMKARGGNRSAAFSLRKGDTETNKWQASSCLLLKVFFFSIHLSKMKGLEADMWRFNPADWSRSRRSCFFSPPPDLCCFTHRRSIILLSVYSPIVTNKQLILEDVMIIRIGDLVNSKNIWFKSSEVRLGLEVKALRTNACPCARDIQRADGGTWTQHGGRLVIDTWDACWKDYWPH